jgi:hypothetical protein
MSVKEWIKMSYCEEIDTKCMELDGFLLMNYICRGIAKLVRGKKEGLQI